VTADGHTGPQRLVDALLGAGVALVFSQLLFPPDPLRLVRAAEAAALNDMARGLKLAGRALESGDAELASRAVGMLRRLGDRLAEVDRLRQASGRVVRHSITWRWQRDSVARENVNAGRLDLLGGSCLMLARAVTAAPVAQQAVAVARTRELAGLLHDLAVAPGVAAVRRRSRTCRRPRSPRRPSARGWWPLTSWPSPAGRTSGQTASRSSPSVARRARAVASGRVLVQWHGTLAPGLQHRLHDPPCFHGLVATHRQGRVAGQYSGEDLTVRR
jgi:hypothetical protein